MTHDIDTLGIRYNTLAEKLYKLKKDVDSARANLSGQISSEKAALDRTNTKINEENTKNLKYENLLLHAWEKLFNFMKSEYPSSEVDSRERTLSSTKKELSEAESALNSFDIKASKLQRCISEFDDARTDWKNHCLYGKHGNSMKGIPAWAVAARVKIKIARTNYAIAPGHSHPGVVFTKDETVSGGIYDFYYKAFHPLKFGVIKSLLKNAPHYWDKYIKATKALEDASKSLGYSLVTSMSSISYEKSKLQEKINKLRKDKNDSEGAVERGKKYHNIVADIGTFDKFINKYDLDSLIKDHNIKDWLKFYLDKETSESVISYLFNTSVEPNYHKNQVKDNEKASGESDKVRSLRSILTAKENELHKIEQELNEVRAKLQNTNPLLLALHPLTGFNVGIKDLVRKEGDARSLGFLVGATAEGGREAFVPWQTRDGGNYEDYNYNLRPLNGNYSRAELTAVVSSVAGSIVSSFKPGHIKLTFVDLERKGLHKKIFQPLIESGLASCITEKNALSQKIQSLQEKIESIYNKLSYHEDVFEAYRKGEITPDYELMVVFGPESVICDEKFKEVITKGAEFGISVFGVPLSKNDDGRKPNSVSDYLTDLYVDTSVLEHDGNGTMYDVLTENMQNIAHSYKKNLERGIRWTEIDRLIEEFPQKIRNQKKVWNDTRDGLIVPIGIRVDNNEPDHYRFHPEKGKHLSLVIGASGSGKSVFLHDIITHLMLKYSPWQVRLHLMDFKSAGIEFKDYQGAPHVQTLLLDGEDKEMAAAILKNLYKEVKAVARKLGDYRNIMDYNAAHPDDPLPFNIFIVDECHKLFEDTAHTHTATDEIREIIGNIAREGRAFGFGFILATQTRKGVRFPKDAESQLNNVYMLQCDDEDAMSLFPRDNIKNLIVPKYHVYHYINDTQAAISKVFTNRRSVESSSGMVDEAYTMILRKMGVFNSDKQFCYDKGRLKEVTKEIASLGYKGEVNRSAVLPLGHKLDVEYTNLSVELTSDKKNSNLLVRGLNRDGQTDRIMLNWIYALWLYNPSRAKVAILNGNPEDYYASNILKKIRSMEKDSESKVSMASSIGEIKQMIESLYKEFERRKKLGRMGSSQEIYEPIVIGTLNHESIISMCENSERFRVERNEPSKKGVPEQGVFTDEEASLLGRIKSSVNPDNGLKTSNPFNKVDIFGSRNQTMAKDEEDISYGMALARMLGEGSPYNIHFVIQKNMSGIQFVTDDALNYVPTKEDDLFMTKIVVSDNDMSLERTTVMLDSDINHLRVYFKRSSDDKAIAMVPYIVK